VAVIVFHGKIMHTYSTPVWTRPKYADVFVPYISPASTDYRIPQNSTKT